MIISNTEAPKHSFAILSIKNHPQNKLLLDFSHISWFNSSLAPCPRKAPKSALVDPKQMWWISHVFLRYFQHLKLLGNSELSAFKVYSRSCSSAECNLSEAFWAVSAHLCPSGTGSSTQHKLLWPRVWVQSQAEAAYVHAGTNIHTQKRDLLILCE